MSGGGSKPSSTTTTTTNGLDPSVSNQLLLSMDAQNKANQSALAAMHRDSMESMKAAMAEMRATHASSDRKFEQLVVSMQSQTSSMMMSMTSMMKSMTDMMGPVMMGGMSGGLASSVLV